MKLAPLPEEPHESLTEGMSPESHISYQVTIVANLMAFGESARNVRQFGIKSREWRVLGCINQVGPATARDIVRLVHQDKGSISRAISGLQKKGLIEKLPNEKHMNSPFIWLTEKGRTLVDEIMPVFSEQAAMFTSVLSANEKKQLCRLLDKLKDNIERVRSEEGI